MPSLRLPQVRKPWLGEGSGELAQYCPMLLFSSVSPHWPHCFCSYRVEPGQGKKVKEKLFLASMVYLVLVPCWCGRRKYWPFLSWTLFCFSEDLSSGDLPSAIPWVFMAGFLEVLSAHFCLPETPFLQAPYLSKPTFGQDSIQVDSSLDPLLSVSIFLCPWNSRNS